MGKSIRTVLVAAMTACLCLVLIIGGTYALFSDSVTVNSHLAAGRLKVGLDMVGYQECVLGNDGTLVVGDYEEKNIDLTSTTTDDITIFNAEKVVPGCWYEATLELSNSGDVAFDYGIRMLWDGENATESQKALAEQMQITVTEGDTQLAEFMLSEYETAGSSQNGDILLGYMLKGDAAKTIVVRAEFIDDENNNVAQLSSVSFDLQIYATQKTANN